MKTVFLSLCLFASAHAIEPCGFVSFKTCMEGSQYGRNEQKKFEQLKQKMATKLEKAEKDLRDLSDKLNDKVFLDTISDEAEASMREELLQKTDDLNYEQNQFYQMLNQFNMKAVHSTRDHVVAACTLVAKEKGLQFVLDDEVSFFTDPRLDVTSLVLVEMDKAFASEEPKDDAPQQ